MTLRRRIILHVTAMIASVAALGGGMALGVRGLRQDFGVALRANRQLRTVYETGLHVVSARRWAREHPPRLERAAEELRRAAFALDHPAAGGRGAAEGDGAAQPVWVPGAEGGVSRVREALRRAAADIEKAEIETPAGAAPRPAHPPPVGALDDALAALAQLSADARTTLTARQAAADAKHRATLVLVLVLSGATVLVASHAGFRLYRSVILPLDGLGQTVRRIAGGSRKERAAAAGDEEFRALSRDFNRMAAELERLCDDLERRVADKSRELARSQRLASVGYLAAGVAHEINNPLGIIVGYGERSLQHLRRGADGPTLARVERAIDVMCEEAFRCKGITDRLLAMARPGPEGFEAVSVSDVARRAVANVSCLPRAAGRRITLKAADGPGKTPDRPDPSLVTGRASDLMQVVLNLLVNALDAVDPDGGHVAVEVGGDADRVRLVVRDDGRGMTADVLEKVFEPFYTDRRGRAPGTGLGLCITQAIVQEHGGSVSADSDGPGRGSRFVVTLPAARRG